MIKLAGIEVLEGLTLRLTFTDGSGRIWDAGAVLRATPTVLTKPLLDPVEFARAFIEGGALAWPNGLEFAPWTLHSEMAEAGLFSRAAA